ncbi:MAG TPA: hypothetical protein VLT45_03455, partial [Kofleriaceae bacterium]|nr:hypothetical protein [Kofleriaceae bacterium]
VADVAPLLADLDLAHASVLLTGPEPDVRHAFELLGRTPAVVESGHDGDTRDVPLAARATTHHERESLTLSEIEPAITEHGAPSLLALAFGAGAAATTAVEQGDRFKYDCCDGYSAFAEVGYRFDAKHAVGLHLRYAHSSGRYGSAMMATMAPMSIDAYDGHAFLQVRAYDRLWGALSFGVHLDEIAGTGETLQGSEAALGFGLEGGVDVLKHGLDRLGLYLQVGGTFLSASGYGSIAIGAAYRR